MMSLTAVLLFLLLTVIGLPIAFAMGLSAGAVIWWFDMPLAPDAHILWCNSHRLRHRR